MHPGRQRSTNKVCVEPTIVCCFASDADMLAADDPFLPLLIAVFINPGAASFFGSKSKSENSRVPEP